jgi:hypothetical protein
VISFEMHPATTFRIRLDEESLKVRKKSRDFYQARWITDMRKDECAEVGEIASSR